ncbi:transcriptional regulator [Litchfieldella qijiaojingensis]|uniref:Transcriptional regulator n=1 Tax=Litchfieldella qijiaojingensis TaxID=980347 RepID=A0ABQ2Z7L0_9GAMM|nr:dimethylsulfonioproprionate lyase family protein [Halomonas qijiaojingensis]GGY07636.1 transcriptional regulator [Halomonas qijiaojingensis]
METRPYALQNYLDSVHEVMAADRSIPAASRSIEKIFTALERPARCKTGEGARLPVSGYLGDALAEVRSASPSLARVANAFEALEPSLTWRRRSTVGLSASDNFADGHANTMIAGPGGFEDRNDVWVGATLMAPHVRYPDHRHSPEEVYLVLSSGYFRQGEGSWFEPGMGGILYNEPGITHAMKSCEAPLFAIWCLWVAE